MKKLIFIMTLITIVFSSCLKDSRYVNFPAATGFVNFPQSGLAAFGSDAMTSDTSVAKFAVSYATTNANPAISVTLAVDPSLMAAYNAANPGIVYQIMPASAYKLSTTSVNIAAGAQYSFVTLTVYKNTLDPTVSYMLPIKIASATGGTISANQSVHYFHVIGNDFAGAYLYDYTRIPAAGNFVGHPGVLLPDSPTQLEGISSYFAATERYIINFTKTTVGGVAMYSNFTVIMNPSDYQSIFVANGLAITTGPTLPNYTAGTSYTYNQVVHGIFKMHYITASGRDVTDYYYKP
ncbi:MAG: hypothetical protein JWP94_3758 [Mucilaginibacter sp.]|jgi:hypothetical protein|nr:hypothetical protein [Mucilaginibacter sp.]